MNLLIIDDDPTLTRLLTTQLSKQGFICFVEHDGASGLAMATNMLFDVILLDLILPDMNGMSVCKQIRERGISSRIIMLSVQSETLDKVKCFNCGADDYVTKPFHIEELIARINVIRQKSTKQEYEYIFEDILLDRTTGHITKGTSSVALTPIELTIISHLLDRKGLIVSKDTLRNKAIENNDLRNSRVIDTHISNIRKKVEKTFGVPNIIITLRSRGVMLKT